MALNFRIKTSKAGDELHLYLTGDFDGSSACQLVRDMAEKAGVDSRRIIVNTDGIQSIHPFGKAVFEKELLLTKRLNKEIVIRGKNADKIADQRIMN